MELSRAFPAPSSDFRAAFSRLSAEISRRTVESSCAFRASATRSRDPRPTAAGSSRTAANCSATTANLGLRARSSCFWDLSGRTNGPPFPSYSGERRSTRPRRFDNVLGRSRYSRRSRNQHPARVSDQTSRPNARPQLSTPAPFESRTGQNCRGVLTCCRNRAAAPRSAGPAWRDELRGDRARAGNVKAGPRPFGRSQPRSSSRRPRGVPPPALTSSSSALRRCPGA